MRVGIEIVRTIIAAAAAALGAAAALSGAASATPAVAGAVTGAAAIIAASSSAWCHGPGCAALVDLAPPAEATAVELIYFRADWCPNCRVLEAVLSRVDADLGGASVLDIWAADGGVRLHVVDLTEPEATAFDALVDEIVDRGLAPVYNSYLGTTGFIAVVAPGASEPALCLARVHAPIFLADWPLQVADKVRAGEVVPAGDDGLCPPRRNPPPN